MEDKTLIFFRRFKSHKFEKVLKQAAIHSFFDTTDKESFKFDLVGSAIDAYLYTKYKIETVNIFSGEDLKSLIKYLISLYEPLIDLYYKNLKKDYPLHHS